MLCTEIVSDIQNNFLNTTCSPHVLQKKRVSDEVLSVRQILSDSFLSSATVFKMRQHNRISMA